MSARMVTSGSAATNPPRRSLRLANSDTSTTTAAVSRYLVISQAMQFSPCCLSKTWVDSQRQHGGKLTQGSPRCLLQRIKYLLHALQISAAGWPAADDLFRRHSRHYIIRSTK